MLEGLGGSTGYVLEAALPGGSVGIEEPAGESGPSLVIGELGIIVSVGLDKPEDVDKPSLGFEEVGPTGVPEFDNPTDGNEPSLVTGELGSVGVCPELSDGSTLASVEDATEPGLLGILCGVGKDPKGSVGLNPDGYA